MPPGLERRRLAPALAAVAVLLGVGLMAAAGLLLWGDGNPWTMAAGPLPAGLAPVALRLQVTRTGLHSVRAADLTRLNFDAVDLNPGSLELRRDGQPVPFFTAGSGEAVTLYFYAEALTTTIDAPAVYWLESGLGQAMAEQDAFPSGPGATQAELEIQWERNDLFVALAPGPDPWFGHRLFAPGSLSRFELPLQDVRATGEGAELTLRFWSNNSVGHVNPDHHLRAWVNDALAIDHLWDGASLETVTAAVPAAAWKDGETTLRLQLPGDTGAPGEDVYLDWVRLRYTAALESTGGQLWFRSAATNLSVAGAPTGALLLGWRPGETPVRLMNAQLAEQTLTFRGLDGGDGPTTYLLVGPESVLRPDISAVPHRAPLSSPGLGADYVAIVAPAPNFDRAIEPLLAHRAQQGLTVRQVELGQIYDEFGFGRPSPGAIRAFIAYAVANWDPAPRFVLLVGDATYDFRGRPGAAQVNWLPTHLVHTEFAGHVASDTWFTLPETGDPVPLVSIGRLPAQRAEQLTRNIAKIIAYEDSLEAPWAERALLVADDEAEFDRISDDLGQALRRAGYQTNALHMTEKEDIRNDIFAGLKAGVGLVNYVGHGSVEVWGDERVFRADDAASLQGTGSFPIFITFTCLNGYFNHPTVEALAEALLWVEDGGIVASIAPSGRSLTLQQQPIADAFYAHLLASQAVSLGEALRTAKQDGAGDPFLRDVIHTFNLLGDPALRYRSPGAAARP